MTRRAAPRMTAMDITIHGTFLSHDDPDACLAFYRDTPPAADPGVTDDERV
jgi:hypothetical protein